MQYVICSRKQSMVWRDKSGDKVPADLRLLQVENLRVDESMLTGESLPIEKNTAIVDSNAALRDRFCLVYSGTLISYGTALGMVVTTGDKTEIVRISSMLRTVPQLSTPLLRLPAVETLGSVTVICSDKTGTLTCNEMTVKAVLVNNKLFTVAGVGYNPEGDFEIIDETTTIEDYSHLYELVRAAALCNNARLERPSELDYTG